MTGSGGSRPGRLILVAGTATEVGKTWVGCRLVEHLRSRGLTVAARKPAQSFDPTEPGPTDAELLAAATGEPPDEVCRRDRSYEVPMAPPMAAAALGRTPVRLDDLIAELVWPRASDVGLVESVGGVRSPIADDGDTVDLADRLSPDLVVVVADAGLGTVNSVRLSLAALGEHPTVVHLNRFDVADDLHRRNLAWLRERDGMIVATAIADLAPPSFVAT